jgi:hypothetical protein
MSESPASACIVTDFYWAEETSPNQIFLPIVSR